MLVGGHWSREGLEVWGNVSEGGGPELPLGLRQGKVETAEYHCGKNLWRARDLQPILQMGKLRTGAGGNSWELVGELDRLSGSAVYSEHGCGLTVGFYGMAHGWLACFQVKVPL